MIKMKLQTKLAFAFLGSAFLALMIWDRGSKTPIEQMAEDDQDEFEDREVYGWGLDKTKHYFESERILTRSKRATVQVAKTLSTVYNQLNEVASCCNVPALLAQNALAYCNKRYSMGQNFPRVRGAPMNYRNWFDYIRGDFLVPSRRANRVNRIRAGGFNNQRGRGYNRNNQRQRVQSVRRGKRQASNAQKVTLRSVCFNACVFNQLNYAASLKTHLVSDPGDWRNGVVA